MQSYHSAIPLASALMRHYHFAQTLARPPMKCIVDLPWKETLHLSSCKDRQRSFVLTYSFASPMLSFTGMGCAIPQDYLSDTTPLLRAMRSLLSQHGQLGAIPPPPFLSISSLESMHREDAIPPPKRDMIISAILARYPMKIRQKF